MGAGEPTVCLPGTTRLARRESRPGHRSNRGCGTATPRLFHGALTDYASVMRGDDGLERVAAAIRGGSGRSSLYRWMRARHDKLAEAMDGERPDWKRLTAEFAALGLIPQDANPETVRHTWWRCRRDVAKAREKRRPKPAATPRPDHFVGSNEMVAGDALAELRREMAKRSGRGG